MVGVVDAQVLHHESLHRVEHEHQREQLAGHEASQYGRRADAEPAIHPEQQRRREQAPHRLVEERRVLSLIHI